MGAYTDHPLIEKRSVSQLVTVLRPHGQYPSRRKIYVPPCITLLNRLVRIETFSLPHSGFAYNWIKPTAELRKTFLLLLKRCLSFRLRLAWLSAFHVVPKKGFFGQPVGLPCYLLGVRGLSLSLFMVGYKTGCVFNFPAIGASFSNRFFWNEKDPLANMVFT